MTRTGKGGAKSAKSSATRTGSSGMSRGHPMARRMFLVVDGAIGQGNAPADRVVKTGGDST
ncbi:MAG TPA: hypothetical protein PKH97_10770 [Tetrasphaera sp.]|uniref:hypothetical protein n=1 Tax=Nostocoides sp. TaxID=1917966 RepID=UPI002B9C177D|nr:hypothetical protein [Tetrasphaera sp.]HNQ07657.1 hypothetical protein [Tetrasphaera sp.]